MHARALPVLSKIGAFRTELSFFGTDLSLKRSAFKMSGSTDARSFLVGAAAGTLLAGGAGLAGVYAYRRYSKAAAAEQDLLRDLSSQDAGRPCGNGASAAQHSLKDEIVAEQLTRNVQFFKAPGQKRVLGAFVVVVGLGVRPSGLQLTEGSLLDITAVHAFFPKVQPGCRS